MKTIDADSLRIIWHMKKYYSYNKLSVNDWYKKILSRTKIMKAKPSVTISHRRKNWHWIVGLGRKLINGWKLKDNLNRVSGRVNPWRRSWRINGVSWGKSVRKWAGWIRWILWEEITKKTHHIKWSEQSQILEMLKIVVVLRDAIG